MEATIDRLKSELSVLPAGQRAEIAEFLLGSLDEGEDDPGVEDAWDEEAARRVEAMRRIIVRFDHPNLQRHACRP